MGVQEMGNMARGHNSDRNDFVFDDQYLELNDDLGGEASFDTLTKSSSSYSGKIVHSKDISEKREPNMYQQFSNSIKRITKPKYVRLDEVFQDDKESDAKFEEGSTQHGYWNPTYF